MNSSSKAVSFKLDKSLPAHALSSAEASAATRHAGRDVSIIRDNLKPVSVNVKFFDDLIEKNKPVEHPKKLTKISKVSPPTNPPSELIVPKNPSKDTSMEIMEVSQPIQQTPPSVQLVPLLPVVQSNVLPAVIKPNNDPLQAERAIKGKAMASLLKKIDAVQKELDEKGELKRMGCYYIALDANKQLIWKPFADTKPDSKPENLVLRSEEEKEVRAALKYILKALNSVVDNNMEVYIDPEIILINLINRIIDRPWCKKMLKNHGKIRRSVIASLYKKTYHEPIEDAKNRTEFIAKTKPILLQLISNLSHLQELSVQEEKKVLSARSLPLIKPPATPIPQRLQDRLGPLKLKQQERLQTYYNHTACVVSVKELDEGESVALAERLKIASLGFNEANEAGRIEYLMKVLSEPQIVRGNFSEAVITVLLETLNTYEQNIQDYYNFHMKWSQFFQSKKKMSKFIFKIFMKDKAMDSQSYAKGVKALESYKSGDYTECLETIFMQGRMNDIFKTVLKSISDLSLKWLLKFLPEDQSEKYRASFKEKINKYAYEDLYTLFEKLSQDLNTFSLSKLK